MARGLLISFAGLPVSASSFFPDNGLASLAGTLLAHGHEVKILDYNRVDILGRIVSPDRSASLAALAPARGEGALDPQVIQRLLEINALLEQDLARVTDQLANELAAEVEAQGSHFVGFKLWSGDGFLASIKIAAHLRKTFPELKIYAGGPVAIYSQETIFNRTNVFDALIVGEGEESIIGLALFSEHKADMTSIPNLITMDGSIIRKTERSQCRDLDLLAMPAYMTEIYPSLAGDSQIKLFVLDESRGCPMGCAFCIHQHASGKEWRIKSPARVIREIQILKEQFGCRLYRFGGSHTPWKFFQGFLEQLETDRINIGFSSFAHPNGMSKEKLSKLRKAGCLSLFFGVESFSSNDLRLLGKKLNPARSKTTISNSIKEDILPIISTIVPVPGGSNEDLSITRQSLIELCGGTRSSAVALIPGLLPHTKWWQEREKYGFKLDIDPTSYLDFLALYKIRHSLPQSTCDLLPYTINGRPFREIMKLNGQFKQELIRHGVVLNVSDDDVLLAHVLKMDVFKFHSEASRTSYVLDASEWSIVISQINSPD